MSQPEEDAHWKMVMRTLLTYQDFVADDLQRRQEHLNRLPDVWADRLPSDTFTKLDGVRHAAEANQHVLHDIVDFYSDGLPPHPRDGPAIPRSQQHRNEAILHSLYREWSADAAAERAQSFGPLVEELQRLLPVTAATAYRQRVLVPGRYYECTHVPPRASHPLSPPPHHHISGLGRLPLEIAALGYQCQGNEFSAFMAMAANFLLNGVTEPRAYTVYPWLDRVCNVVRVGDVMAPAQVPALIVLSLALFRATFTSVCYACICTARCRT